MKDKLRAGVIGMGVGVRHACGYLEHKDVELVAVAAKDDLHKVSEKCPGFTGKVYEDAYEMLAKEKLDIVSVAVPNFLHKEFTIAALESGAHVLCEKPMALNASEAQEMLDASKRCGKKLGINFSYRFYPQSQAMKSIVDEGLLGNIYYGRTVWLRRRGIPGLNSTARTYGTWFFDKKRAGGGPLIDLGVHRLDLALWLMGYPEPEWVMASTYDKLARRMAAENGVEYSVEDMACAMIKFKNGATLELDAAWAVNIKEREFQQTRIAGEKGGLFQYNVNEEKKYEIEYYYDIDGRQFDSRLHTLTDVPSAYSQFVDAVRDDKPFSVTPEQGVTVMRILDAVYKSAAEGAPVKIG
ncbi:MAG: Gfo/Idh/MocA family oxidoreductase [Lentisphaeria bacterium]|nr:Gfo/Idh/MocA family oxidoreductase [Lentisphaeria bacterium]